jgi:hypothetical protein
MYSALTAVKINLFSRAAADDLQGNNCLGNDQPAARLIDLLLT